MVRRSGARRPVAPSLVMIGSVTAVKYVASADRVVAELLDAEQAPVGWEADLPQSGQIGQPFPDPEVAGVVDGGFRSQRSSLLVVLLDGGVLVVGMQARGDAVGDHPGAEPARGWRAALGHESAVKDQADLVRPADVEVVADDLFEEDPPGHRPVQHLGQGELGLQDRNLIPVPGVGVRRVNGFGRIASHLPSSAWIWAVRAGRRWPAPRRGRPPRRTRCPSR